MKPMTKHKRYENEYYLNWIRKLPCSICGITPSVPHHLIAYGDGSTGSKAGDHMAVPLCTECHTKFHADFLRDTAHCIKCQLIWMDKTIEKWMMMIKP